MFRPNVQDRTWKQIDDSFAVEAPHLRALYELWIERRAARQLPARSDFEAAELARFEGCVVLFDVERDPLRIRCRLVGTHVTMVVGRDSTGRYLDEIYEPEHYAVAIESYRQCVEARTPVRSEGWLAHTGRDYIKFETVDLPLGGDGTNVDMIVKGVDFPQTNV